MNTRAWALLIALTFACGQVSADVIYRETFGRLPQGADDGMGGVVPNDQSVNLADWADFLSTGAFNTDIPSSGLNGSTDGRPIDVENVNAGPNVDGSTGPLPRGIHYFLTGAGAPVLSFTPEYSFDPADYEAGSVVFSWYEGNAMTTDSMRLAIQVGGQDWYAHATQNTTPATTLGQFPSAAVLQQVTFDPASANWLALDFDGSYDTITDMGTASTVPLSLGAAPGASLTGEITAFGVYVEGAAGTRRFDTFEINATPLAAACSIAGDFNCNGSVENADLTLLLNNWAAAVPPTPAGWDGPAPTAPAIDNDELTSMLNTWGQTQGTGSSVPEPSAMVLFVLGLAGVATKRRAG